MRFILLLVLVICTVMVVNGGVVRRSDDVNLQALQTLVQQQAAAISSQQAAISSLQATVNSQQAKITGLDNKVQTLTKPVAFTARFSNDHGDNGVPMGPHQTLVFDSVVTNAGNGYDHTTGIFRAPLAGYYAFSIVAMLPNGPSRPGLGLSIIKNGDLVDEIWVNNDQTDNNEQGSTNAVVHLAAGDQVWIRQELGDGVRGGALTVFTGFLVHAD